MRKALIFMAMAVLFIAIERSAETEKFCQPAEKQSMAFVTYIGAPYQEAAAAMLVDSIRTWGGEYRNCPIYVVLTDPQTQGIRLKDKNVKLIPLKLEELVLNYPFAAKAYAAAKVEELIGGESPRSSLVRPGNPAFSPASGNGLERRHFRGCRPGPIRQYRTGGKRARQRLLGAHI
jgi:hypothetical protein